MALDLADRLLTIAVTATLTSAAWIVVGSSYVERGGESASAPFTTAEKTSREAPPPTGASHPGGEAPGSLMVPVAGVSTSQLSDTFDDPRGGGQRPHEALDIPAPAGTPVVAAAGGTLEKLFLSDEGGKTVYVRSPDRRTLHYYAHLQDYAPGLKEGQAVVRGQPLGTVGATGNADPAAPHLHFAVMRIDPGAKWWESATAVNPYPLLVGAPRR